MGKRRKITKYYGALSKVRKVRYLGVDGEKKTVDANFTFIIILARDLPDLLIF